MIINCTIPFSYSARIDLRYENYTTYTLYILSRSFCIIVKKFIDSCLFTIVDVKGYESIVKIISIIKSVPKYL